VDSPTLRISIDECGAGGIMGGRNSGKAKKTG
jgi:hypothetical protein